MEVIRSQPRILRVIPRRRSFTGLSMHISDPFVRRVVERAEREDGTPPAVATVEPRKHLQGRSRGQ